MNDIDNSGFRHDRYSKTFEDIFTLSEKLPEDSVVSLAKEVLSRLSGLAEDGQDNEHRPSNETIESLARALISRDLDAGSKFVADLQRQFVPPQRIYLDYLARAAKQLGEWWTSDEATFVEVTLGTGRIYAIMRAMSDMFEPRIPITSKTAVFCTVPGETHSLGVRMATDMFRKNGWRIDLNIGMSHSELVESIGSAQHILIGLSGGGIHSVADMARLVIALRISNPKARILVSGNVIEEAREMVELMDVDAISNDFEAAQADMEELWRQIENDSVF